MQPIDNNQLIAMRALRRILPATLQELQTKFSNPVVIDENSRKLFIEEKVKLLQTNNPSLQGLSEQQIIDFITRNLDKSQKMQNKGPLSRAAGRLASVPKEAAKVIGAQAFKAKDIDFNESASTSLTTELARLREIKAKRIRKQMKKGLGRDFMAVIFIQHKSI